MPARSRMSNRSCGVVRDHFLNAVRADAIACSTSDEEARANSPTTSVRFDGLTSVVRSVESSCWPSIRFGKCRCHRHPHESRGLVDVREVAQDVDHRGEILRALALRPRRAERLAGGGADRHGHLDRVGGVDNQRQVLVREVDREPGLGVALEHLGGPRNLELTVGRRRPVHDIQRLLEREAEPLRQRQRLRVEGARDDRQIVVHELRPHARAGAAAMMDRRAHRLEQRLHARKRLGRRAHHEQRFAALGMAGQPSDRRVDERDPLRRRPRRRRDRSAADRRCSCP